MSCGLWGSGVEAARFIDTVGVNDQDGKQDMHWWRKRAKTNTCSGGGLEHMNSFLRQLLRIELLGVASGPARAVSVAAGNSIGDFSGG